MGRLGDDHLILKEGELALLEMNILALKCWKYVSSSEHKIRNLTLILLELGEKC